LVDQFSAFFHGFTITTDMAATDPTIVNQGTKTASLLTGSTKPPTGFCDCSCPNNTNTYAYTVSNSVTCSVTISPTVVLEVECEVDVLVPMVLTEVR